MIYFCFNVQYVFFVSVIHNIVCFLCCVFCCYCNKCLVKPWLDYLLLEKICLVVFFLADFFTSCKVFGNLTLYIFRMLVSLPKDQSYPYRVLTAVNFLFFIFPFSMQRISMSLFESVLSTNLFFFCFL